MHLNNWGQIVVKLWMNTPKHNLNILLDEFICMPNHTHGILWILNASGQPMLADAKALATAAMSHYHPEYGESDVGAQHAVPLHHSAHKKSESTVKPGSLSAIIRSYKSAVTREINTSRANKNLPVWQPRFHDRIIRNERELFAIRHYIRTNPQNWKVDSEWNARLEETIQEFAQL